VSSGLRGSFVLAHPAQVRVTIERPSGVVVRRLFTRSLTEGTVPVIWDGRDDRGVRAYAGRYVLRVTATNELGTMSLTRPFSLRRG
jgi:flagellar hook assembly protein FlgD